jgi:beta-lactamase superfamily II metal-dependent hydrolase
MVYKMNKLKVLNVGQGDATILSINDACRYQDYDIFVDLGNGKYDVSKLGDPYSQKILVLSHAHQDHIGGLSLFISSLGSNKDLKEIWMPLFFEEICIITDKILQLRGIQNVSYMNGALLSAKNTVSAFHLLQKLSKSTSINMVGIYEGYRLCYHLDFFHPPIDPAFTLGLTNEEISQYIESLEETDYAEIYSWFSEPYATELISMLRQNEIRDDQFSQNGTFTNFENQDLREIRSRFSFGLLLKLRNSINKFVQNPGNMSFISLFNLLKKSSNDCSIVFKYFNNNLDVLFTGDISKKILDHLTKRNSLEAKILKIPHHGSKNNLSKRTLKQINPTYAIISHGNGRFGRQRDPHPNKEVIKMLNDLNITSIFTNDVIKNNKVIISRPNKVQIAPQIEYYDKY